MATDKELTYRVYALEKKVEVLKLILKKVYDKAVWDDKSEEDIDSIITSITDDLKRNRRRITEL